MKENRSPAGSAFWRQATLGFGAGALGAAAALIILMIFSVLSIIPAPDVTKLWLYTALVWGGLWGFLFLIPWKASLWLRGLVFSLGPTAGVWFVIYPSVANLGVLGLSLGIRGPLVPLIANGVWGLVAAWWCEFVGARGRRELNRAITACSTTSRTIARSRGASMAQKREAIEKLRYPGV